MAVELATAYVPIVPSFKGVKGNLTRGLSSAVPVAESTGRSMGSKMASGVKTMVKGAGIGAALLSAVTLKGGWDRALNLEDARGKLKGLGHDTQTVDKIMKNAYDSTVGTAYRADEAASVAAAAVASGIKPGKELKSVLSLMGDAAYIAGTDMGEMGAIFNKVAASDMIQGDVLNQLLDRGVPILQLLGKEMGVSAAKVRELASEGKINFATFRRAMQAGMGGAAQEAGKTTRGAIANMVVSFSTLGQTIVERFMPQIKSGINMVTSFMVDLNKRAGPALDDLFAAAKRLDFSSIQGFLASLKSVGGETGGVLSSIGNSLMKLAPAAADFAAAIPDIAGAGLKVLAAGLGFLAEHVDTLIKFMPLLVAGFVAWKVGQMAVTAATAASVPVMTINNILRLKAARAELQLTAAQRVNTIATRANTAATNTGVLARTRAAVAAKVQRIATIATTAATNAAAIATRALGAAIRFATGPIGLIILGITALVAGLVWFFTKTKLGQAIVAAVWKRIQAVVGAVVTWFTQTALPFMLRVWNTIGQAAKLLFARYIRPAWQGIKIAVALVYGWFRNVLLPGIGAVFKGVGAVFRWLWAKIVKPVFGLIKAYIGLWWTAAKLIFHAVVAFIRGPLSAGFRFLRDKVVRPVFRFIGSIITGFWAGAKKTFNSVIGFVKGALTAGFRFLRDKVVRPVFQKAGSIITGFWTGAKKTFNSVIGFVKGALTAAFRFYRDKVVLPVFRKINEIITGFWTGAKKNFQAAVDFIRGALAAGFRFLWNKIVKPIMDWIGDKVRGVWRKYLRPAFKAIKDAVGKIPNAFEKAKDGIGKAWDKLRSIAKSPVRFVIEQVINKGLIGTFNKIPGVDLPTIDLPKGFARGGRAPKGWAMVGEQGPELVNFERPGRVYTAEQTGQALRHADDSRGAAANGGGFGAIWGGFQNAIRSAGRLFVGGGAGPAWQIPAAASMWDRLAGIRVKGGQGHPQATTGLGPLGSILAWATGAGNITFNTGGLAPGLSPTMKRATAAHEIGHVLGLPHTGAASIMQPVMGKYMQPTPFDVSRLRSLYGKGQRGAGDPVGPPPNPFEGILDALVNKLKDAFPAGGMFIDAAAGIIKSGVGQITKFIGSFAGDIADKIAGVSGAVFGALKNFFGFGAKPPVAALHDDGGKVMPGRTLVDNDTRKPEALLNPMQWNTAHRAMRYVTGDARRRGSGLTINGDVTAVDAQALARTIETEKAKREALYAGRI